MRQNIKLNVEGIFLSSAEDKTQDLIENRQALYHRHRSSALRGGAFLKPE